MNLIFFTIIGYNLSACEYLEQVCGIIIVLVLLLPSNGHYSSHRMIITHQSAYITYILLFEERRFDLFGAEFRPRFALLQESLGDCGEFCRLDIRHFIN